MESIDKQLLELCQNCKKSEAVILYMESTRLDLKTAKDYVENLKGENGYLHKRTKFNYQVENSMANVQIDEISANKVALYAMIKAIFAILGIIFFIIDLFRVHQNLFNVLVIICLGLFIYFHYLYRIAKQNADLVSKKKKAQNEADSESHQLNELLTKSSEIADKILPFFENAAIDNLEISKSDFAENAISPFWDKIEQTSQNLGYYKDAIEQLLLNGELYSVMLKEKKHNFPIPFPIGENISFSQTLLDDYNTIIRKGQSIFEFANIWEHRKEQKILIAGFATLEQAINGMKIAIVNAINNLRHSIKTEFREVKANQLEQIRSYEAGQRMLNNTLSSMNDKLYYLQYKKHPNQPFIRPLLD